MNLIRGHLNSLLILAGFILMAGGGAELSMGDQRPQEAGPTRDPEGAIDFFPEQNIIPQFFPIPLAASDPEQPAQIAAAPEAAAPEEPEAANPNYDGELERYATGNMLWFIEGPFGALIMVSAGIGAIIAGAFGAYKAAISLLFVAVGAFILRALVSLFFGTGYDPYTTGGGVGDFVGGNGGGL